MSIILTVVQRGCKDMEVLFKERVDGTLAFPKLEDVTLWGFDSALPSCPMHSFLYKQMRSQDRQSILQIAAKRLYDARVPSIKHMCIDPRIADDWEDPNGWKYESEEDLYETELAEELEKYIPVVDWVDRDVILDD